jgi:tetratricopeptide (TPR) repeat protein
MTRADELAPKAAKESKTAKKPALSKAERHYAAAVREHKLAQAAVEYERAQQAYRDGSLRLARERCERAKAIQEMLQDREGLVDALLLEARTCRFLGHTEQAVAFLAQAAKLSEDDPQRHARVALNAFLTSLDRGVAWQPWLELLRRHHADSHEVGCLVLLADGLDLAARGQLREAHVIFSKLSRDEGIEDLRGDLERGLGQVLLSSGKLEKARTRFAAARKWFEARSLLPELASLRLDSAKLLIEAEDADAAITDLEDAMEDFRRYGMTPAICDACALIVRASLRLERYETAVTAAGALGRFEKRHDIESAKARAFIWLAWTAVKKRDRYGACKLSGRGKKIAETLALTELQNRGRAPGRESTLGNHSQK